MSVLVVGLSHRSAPVEVLERLAVAPGDVPKLLEEMLDRAHVEEAVLLSTCNRIEVCAVVDAFHGGLGDVTDVLGSYAGFPIGELSDHLFVHYAGSAVQHMFQLAAGLDSMVVGESQILGQLRGAYATADESGSVGKVLHELVQQALRVGKRVHAGTGIDEAGASIVSEALRDADRELGGTGLDGARAVVVGAGAMGALAAAHLRRAGASEIVVLNRSAEGAERLAEKVREQGTAARTAPLDSLTDELRSADLLLACTGAIGHVVHADPVAEALSGGRSRPLVVCDLGLPRDVDPAVGELPGVRMVDLVTLQRRLLDVSDDAAGGSIALAHRMVEAEAQQYLAGQRSAEVTPTVTALRRRASEVVDAELLRLDSRLPDLDGRVREELSRTVRRVVDKLLHTPTVQVKRLAEGPDGDSYAAALRTLFELDPQAAAAVAAPVRGTDATVDGTDVTAALNAPLDRTPSIGSRPPEQIS
ncbi:MULTISPECIES: glutamyl-tRNA reductase [Pseudonocardia]|uniref:Glutamyl-tRNA reductase n=2 Tax=Pseudonocardia TaxID=1847 RepID=A0A1Y2NAC6_PSEAH|nr:MULTISPECIES: glutamyl-tRNA reductase [Pseudonocardia]OSY44181.1 Glutamyl-tRNA reductase [Pseudonocardia autotrophica]TDN74089.1 glutamyl-tRNA reductase [Pseudonocardia autotrophica]BBG04847.1 glutamyl-tRNA reductase [Pseudonocardia autotrophica]GEC23503.1 glutamyl-tRNA reductase [Pseudonocardia saturnea]